MTDDTVTIDTGGIVSGGPYPNERDEFIAAWMAVYGEQNPGRDPERMQYTEAMLAGLLLLRREMRVSRALPHVVGPVTCTAPQESPRYRIQRRLGPYSGDSV